MSASLQEWLVLAAVLAAAAYIVRRVVVKRRMRACPGCDDATSRRSAGLPVISSRVSEP